MDIVLDSFCRNVRINSQKYAKTAVHQVRVRSLAESLDKGIDLSADNGMLLSVVAELMNAHTVLASKIPKQVASYKSSIFRGIGDLG